MVVWMRDTILLFCRGVIEFCYFSFFVIRLLFIALFYCSFHSFIRHIQFHVHPILRPPGQGAKRVVDSGAKFQEASVLDGDPVFKAVRCRNPLTHPAFQFSLILFDSFLHKSTIFSSSVSFASTPAKRESRHSSLLRLQTVFQDSRLPVRSSCGDGFTLDKKGTAPSRPLTSIPPRTRKLVEGKCFLIARQSTLFGC